MSYISKDITGALGLSAPYEPVTVQVLNDSTETFDTMLVGSVLEEVMETSKSYSNRLRAHDRSQETTVWWIGSDINNVAPNTSM